MTEVDTGLTPPTAEQIASLVEPDESDQLSDEGTSDGEKPDESADGKTKEGGENTDDGGEAKDGADGEPKSKDGEDGSDGKDTDGEDAGEGSDAGTDAITLGEKEYSTEQLTQIVKDHDNREAFAKANTERAQEIAATLDKTKGVLGFIGKLIADPESLETLQALTGVQLDEKALAEFKEVQELSESKGDAPTELDIIRAELTVNQWRMAHLKEFSEQEAWDRFVQFASEKQEPDIDKAYTLFKADGAPERIAAAEKETAKEKIRADAAEKAAEESPPAPLGRGPKKITTDFKPSKDGTYGAARDASAGMLKEAMKG